VLSRSVVIEQVCSQIFCNLLGGDGLRLADAYFSPSWTAFQADRGRDFSVMVDGVSN